MDEIFGKDLESLDDLTDNVSYHVAKKVRGRLADLARKQGRKPGQQARYLLETSLGFRKASSIGSLVKEDLNGLDTFTDAPFSFRVARKVKKRLKDLALRKGRKPNPYARYLLEISLGFRAPESASELPHIYAFAKKKTSNQ